jgi:hypothetical protein
MGATLVVKSRPWLETLVGGLFIAGGTWALVSGEAVFGGGFIVAGLVLIGVFANVVTSTFDKTSGQFTRRLRGVVRRTSASHALSDITAVRIETTNTADSPSKSYRVVLVLKSGKRVPVSSSFSSGREDKERLASEIRRFLGLPDVREPDPPGFGEMIAAMRGGAHGRDDESGARFPPDH